MLLKISFYKFLKEIPADSNLLVTYLTYLTLFN